jgi:hypothetical protein
MNPVHEFLMLREKTAGFLSDLGKAVSGSLTPEHLGPYFAPAIASAGVAAAGLGMKAGYDAIRERLTRQRDYKMMLENNPNLRGLDAKHVATVYNSFRRLSPTMARDPLLAGSFVYKTVSLSPESGLSIDPMTAKTIAETQKSIQQAKSSKTSVYEAMLGGLGKSMPGPQMSFGMSGPQVSGIGSRAVAEQMGLPTDFASAAKQREEQARAEKMMPTYQRPEGPTPPLVLGQRSSTTRISPTGEKTYETRMQKNIFKKK